MPSTLSWYIENEIIYIHVWGKMTLDDMLDTFAKSEQLFTSSSREWVHQIIDVGDVDEALPLSDVLTAIRKFGKFPENTGWFIILREKSLLIRLGFTMGTSLFKARTRTFNKMEEAVAFLKEKDVTINWDNADESIIKA